MELFIAQQDGTFSEKDDATVNELSSLTPYRNENGTYWTSNNARSVLKGGLPKCKTSHMVVIRRIKPSFQITPIFRLLGSLWINHPPWKNVQNT